MRDNREIKGWTWLTGDMSWDDVNGTWARKGRDGAWWVLVFTNMIDACGERDAAEIGFVYECQVKRLDMSELDEEKIDSALKYSGYEREADGSVYTGNGDVETDPATIELMILECCISSGLGAPMHDETGSVRPVNVRGRARAYAERMMRDDTAREAALNRVVNKVGSTAAEYGRGDISSGLLRHLESGENDPAKDLMIKLGGLSR